MLAQLIRYDQTTADSSPVSEPKLRPSVKDHVKTLVNPCNAALVAVKWPPPRVGRHQRSSEVERGHDIGSSFTWDLIIEGLLVGF